MDNLDVSDASWRAGPPQSALVLERVGDRGLRDISMMVSPGERVAVVGPAGGGGDALFNWLRGAAKPGRGRILIGGAQTRGGPPAFWEAGIRWAGQAPKRFGLRAVAESAVWLRLFEDDGPALAEDDEAILARRPDRPSAAGFDRIVLFDGRGKIADDTPAAIRARYGP